MAGRALLRMRRALILSMALLGTLCACGRGGGLYADRSVAIVAPAASAEAAPRFVGQWARAPAQCQNPWVIKAHSLQTGDHVCDFDKVDSSSAGYTASAVCRSAGKMNPTRLTFIAPDQARISLLTVQGGPFTDAVALQRCPGS